MFRSFKPFEASAVVEFRDPDTGHLYQAKTLKALYLDIIRYRAQNNLDPIEELNRVVENYLCSLPENCNKCDHVELHRSFSTYIKGGIQLLKNMAFRAFAPQEVAEKRAAQCVACPMNVFPDKGPFMKWADEIAIQQVGERKSSLHNELGSCAVCQCPLRSKVFVAGPLPKFTDEEVEKFKDVKCWQLKLSGQE